MTPEQIGGLTALVGLLEKVSGWPVWFLILLLIIGPWIVMLLLDRNNERRFLAQKQQYDSNVTLLKETQSIAKDLKEIVILSTQTSQKLTDSVEQNQFCPMLRLEKQAKGIHL
jgi:hypothetical protein